MTSSERRTRQRAELQERILDAARELFARHGFEAVTLRKIAAAIEYAPAAIYGHFSDKKALIRALCLRDFDQLNAEFARHLSIADPLARLAAAGRTFVRFMAANPNHFRVLFLQHRTLPEDDDTRARKGDPARDSYAFLCHAVQEALEQGQLRAELTDKDLVAQTIWAVVQGVASIEVAFRNDPWVALHALDARAEAAIDAVLRGLARPGAWPSASPRPRAPRKKKEPRP